VLLAEQDHPGHHGVEEGRAERARPAHFAARVVPGADQIEVAAAVDLAAAEEESVEPALGGQVEQPVKALPRRMPSTRIRGSRARANMAAVPGIGESMPTATLRQPSRSRAMTAIKSSSRRQSMALAVVRSCRGRARVAGVAKPRQVSGKALLGLGQADVVGELRRIGPIGVVEGQRPGAGLGLGDGADVERRDGAGRGLVLGQQVAVDDLLDRDQGLLGRGPWS
jgi:hypothetical protein